MGTNLPSWNDTAARQAVLDFVAKVCDSSNPGYVPPQERIAVFDNDGTLWCEKPMYIQLDFILQRWVEMVDENPALKRLYIRCGYAPMIELLHFLEANGFTNYIASGGGRDFMRPVTAEIYGIPPDRVIGSSVSLEFRASDKKGGDVLTKPQLNVLDDGPVKPPRIWSRIGRRPIFCAGNSNGDIQMLQYTEGSTHPSLCLLVNHDDDAREFDYTAGAEDALKMAQERGWIAVSMQQDWSTVFAAEEQ